MKVVEVRQLKIKGKNGFTLIELVVVLAILGILSAIAIATLGGTTADAKKVACMANRKTLEKELMIQNARGSDVNSYFLQNTRAVNGSAVPNISCPDAGTYSLNPSNLEISCSIAGHNAPLEQKEAEKP